ncbi:MAG: PP2C family protein-serine/threonine phosphatase [Chloroflexi bacterium OHK40]
MATVSFDIEDVLAALAPETRRQRRSALLRPLNASLIAASFVGLAVMVSVGGARWGYVIIATGLLLNIVVAVLDRFGRTSIAAVIFVLWLNSGTLVLSGLNLLTASGLANGAVFACVLTLSVVLAGLLLGGAYAVIFSVANTIAVIALLHQFFSGVGASPGIVPLVATLSIGVPIAVFLFLAAVITWLYLRAIEFSEARLSVARRRIMQDELIRRDLAIARELQQRLYPPPPLTGTDLHIASRSEPARETSGDFYDFIDLDNGLLGIVVADVTGKSIAAALMMALARSTLRSVARRHGPPADVLHDANEALCRDHSAHQMITAFYGVLDTRTLTLRFSNAGHPYPLLRRNGTLLELEQPGLPLGARPDARYGEQVLHLQPGDQLYLVSDGLIEERNHRRELFGYERLCAAITGADPLVPERAIEQLWQAVAGFRGETEQDDDITVVVIQVAQPLSGQSAPVQVEAPAVGG